MKIIVFAGPSLRPDDRARAPHVRFLPPARQGDVLRLLHDPPAAIGLIDGVFGDALAVSHKELLEALSRGVPVLGAASMGALRAAELHPWGMEGIGAIYRALRSGEISNDGDVAVRYGPEALGYPLLSVPLVDVRATVAALQMRGALDHGAAHRIVTVAQGMFFAQRSWEAIAGALEHDAICAAQLRSAHVERKRLDAIQLLARLRIGIPALTRRPDPPPRPPAYQQIRARHL